MLPSSGLRRRQREAAGVEIEVLPPDGENLADAKAGDGGEPNRGHLCRVRSSQRLSASVGAESSVAENVRSRASSRARFRVQGSCSEDATPTSRTT